jgi:hypothetical protein
MNQLPEKCDPVLPPNIGGDGGLHVVLLQKHYLSADVLEALRA